MPECILPLQHENMRQVLLTGLIPNESGRWVAQKAENDQVSFSQVDGVRISVLRAWLVSIRAISLTATLMPALACLILLHSSGFKN